MSPLSVRGCVCLVGLAATGACGRAALTDEVGAEPAGSGGQGGTTGAGGAGGRVPSQHRATAEACPVVDRSGPSACQVVPQDPSVPGLCNVDGDCFAKPNGRCEIVRPSGGCACVYDACVSDADCGGGNVCACNPVELGNRCVTVSCRVDGDCGAGGYCGPVINPCTREIVTYQCHSPRDMCLVDWDCPITDSCDAYPGQVWACRVPVGCR